MADFRGQAGVPRGLRDNNPGDFRPGEAWQGVAGSEGGFLVFKDITWGLRALALDIINNVNKGVDTIRTFITKYAPPTENDTAGYINFVSAFTGLGPDLQLGTDPDTIYSLMQAIINRELGPSFAAQISNQDVTTGLEMAQGGALATLPAAAAIAVQENPLPIVLVGGFLAFFIWAWDRE